MARATAGGGAGDFVATVGTDRIVRATQGSVTIWDAEEGGTQLTDLLLNGVPVTSIPTDANGQVPAFKLPDGVGDDVWADGGGPRRVRLVTDKSDEVLASDAFIAEQVATPGTDTEVALGAKIAEGADTALLAANATHEPSLRKWYAALGNRYTVPARVLVMGDSNSEGTGAGSFRKRWQALLQQNLLTRFPVAGVAGSAIAYITANPRQTPALTDSPVTVVGAAASSFGLGLRAMQVQSGHSVTFTFTGDRCVLVGTKSSTSGIFNIVLDGGAAVTVDGYNAGGTLNSQLLWNSGAIGAGAHTVVVTRDAGSFGTRLNVYVEGLLAFNGDYSSGVRVVDAARHGAQATLFSDGTGWQTAIATTGPYHLAVMPWGANEINAGASVATFKARVLDLIADMRAAGFAGSVLLVGMPKRSEAADATWTAYLDAQREIAAADADVAFLDLRARIPDAGTAEATTLDLYVDTVHYKPGAQGWIADEITNAITPR